MWKKRLKSYYEKVNEEYRLGLITKAEMLDKLKKHEEKLEKKRKYKKGDIVTSFEELLSCEFVYMYGDKPKHRSFVISQTFRTIIILLQQGRIRKAVKKEES